MRSIVSALVCGIGCGGRGADVVMPTPTAPIGSGPIVNARVVSTLTDEPVSGASATGASIRSTLSDPSGLMMLEASGPGRHAVTVAAAPFVTRQTRVSIPGGDACLDLIPRSFDLVAFDQMFRGATSGGRLIKWRSAPALVVQRSGLVWANSPADRYLVEGEQWTDGEIADLIADLTFGLQTISGGVFPAFSVIRIEQATVGTMLTVPQTGAIVVARYRALRGPSGDNVAGLGTTDTDNSAVIRGGVLKIDRTVSPLARPLRVHELGHTLGLSHVTSRTSFMNPSGNTSLPNEADREAFRVAARRPPGNLSPDVDPTDFVAESCLAAAR